MCKALPAVAIIHVAASGMGHWPVPVCCTCICHISLIAVVVLTSKSYPFGVVAAVGTTVVSFVCNWCAASETGLCSVLNTGP